jgi:lipopolysaccharide transport system ATP-binding protein
MTAIKSLCSKGVLLNEGKFIHAGDIDKIVDQYQQISPLSSKALFEEDDKDAGNDLIRIHSIKLEGEMPDGTFLIDKPLSIEIELSNYKVISPVNINLFFNSPDGTNIFATCSTPELLEKRKINFKCCITANFFNDNRYVIDVMAVTNSSSILYLQHALYIEGIEPPRPEGWMDKFPGYIRPSFTWSVNR